MSRTTTLRALTCAVLCALVSTQGVRTAPPEESPTYVLTAWTADKGAPSGDVWTMAQDAAGYLWLGTSEGLVRFDGFEFTPWGRLGGAALPGNSIQSLISTRDGSLWVGFGDAPGPVRIRQNRVTAYGASDGFSANAVPAVAEGPDGAIWAGARDGLHRFAGGRWSRVGPAEGAPAAQVYSLYMDRKGGLSVGSAAGVFHLAPGAARFELVTPDRAFVQSFAEDASGRVWVGHTEQIVASLLPGPRPDLAADVRVPTPGWRLLTGVLGDIWIAALGGGLLHLRGDAATGRPVIERVRYEHTLTGSPRALFQDRHQDLWVGMRGGGLLRVAEAAVRTGTRLVGLTNDGVRAITAQPDGSVWVATGHNVNVFGPSGVRAHEIAQTMALHTDTVGRVWAATHEGVGRIENGRFVPMPLPRPIRTERVTSLTSDRRGGLWLCSVDEGVLRLAPGILEDFSRDADVARRSCTYAYGDSRGRVWLGFSRGGVATYEEGRFTNYGEKDNLASGTVMAIYEDREGAIWVGTSSGLSRFAGGRFVTADADNGLPGSIVPSVIDDGEGALWVGVGSGAGLIRFTKSEFDSVAADPAYRLRYALYDASDGLQGMLHWFSHPSAVRTGDGLLWLVTGTGIAVVDPKRLPAPDAPAAPRIARVVLDGQPAPAGETLQVPHSTSSLAVEYTALALSGASKLRFRYMLEGLGADWVDAGVGRVATFSDLPPGSYRFRVASTAGGAWTEATPALAITVLPPFYRTAPFYVACAAALSLLLWAYWWARMRAVQRRFAVVLDERARLSREIHDTLLQDLGAIRLRLDGLTARVARSDRDAGDMLRALHAQVGRCIREARHAIWELRSPRRDSRDLVVGFEGLAADARASAGTPVTVTAAGTPWQCAQEVEEQLLRIGQEALANAVRHGHASQIGVTVDYGDDALEVRIDDDGVGFAASGAGASEGHWGLLNMQERAASIGGRLEVSSAPGRGTTVAVSVRRPAQRLASRVAM
jgi:signal transduction histidine kinase/ligand-binding sensor domain-containing protein